MSATTDIQIADDVRGAHSLHPGRSVRVLDAAVAQIRDEAEKEAEHWKSLGDMYGWNFWKGVASGAIKVQLRFQALNKIADRQP